MICDSVSLFVVMNGGNQSNGFQGIPIHGNLITVVNGLAINLDEHSAGMPTVGGCLPDGRIGEQTKSPSPHIGCGQRAGREVQIEHVRGAEFGVLPTLGIEPILVTADQDEGSVASVSQRVLKRLDDHTNLLNLGGAVFDRLELIINPPKKRRLRLLIESHEIEDGSGQ